MPMVAPASSHGPEKGLTSRTSAVFFLSCMSLGVGVFAMPTVINSVGWVVGVALILFFGALTTTLMLLTMSVVEMQGCDDWDMLVRLIPGGLTISRVSMVVSCITANAGHLQLLAGMLFDLMQWFVTGEFGIFPFTAVHKLVILSLLLGIALPYTFMDNVGALQHVGKAVAGVVLTTCFVCSCCAFYQVWDGHAPTGAEVTPAWPVDVKAVFTSMSTIAFAFTSMYNLFETFDAMKRGCPNNYMPKMKVAVIGSGAIVTFIYLTVSVSCIMAFGVNAGVSTAGNGSGNALYNFPPDNYVVTVLCLALIVVIMLDYAIIMFPAVNVIMKTAGVESTPYARQVINIIIAGVVTLVVMVVPNLGDVFGLCGSLGVSVFCYVLPGTVCLRFHPNLFAKLISAVAVCVGMTMLILSTLFILENVAHGK